MAVKKISIADFMQLHGTAPILDVRSPGEYNHAHIPGAYSLPLFSDEERKIVGTTYKQKSREHAIKSGLDYFGVKMSAMIGEAELIIKNNGWKSKKIFVHCWRGGMRSAGVAWLLDLYGFDVHIIVGGYKSFRNWVLHQFEKDYPFKVIGGYTGSGKSNMLRTIFGKGHQVLDLELLACHKGSAFGGISMPPQPSQEMFENLLAIELSKKVLHQSVWVEDESQRIGVLNIPHALWKTIRQKPVFFVEVPFEVRLGNILGEYGILERSKLEESVFRIQKRLGPLETKTTLQHLGENNFKEAFRILLKYYDKTYDKALHNRENLPALLNRIPGENCVTTLINTSICEPIPS